MYSTMLKIIEGQEWDNSGVPLTNAERLFFDCCTTTTDSFMMQEDDSSGEDEGNESAHDYNETIRETRAAIEELRPIMVEWINLMDKVDNELTHDSSRHTIERAASTMLMKWASIVTE